MGKVSLERDLRPGLAAARDGLRAVLMPREAAEKKPSGGWGVFFGFFLGRRADGA